ncbi:hypothetical protein GCM10020331_092910 [Ectobacillus funiculus]
MWQRVKDTGESECRHLEREQESRKLYNWTDTVVFTDKPLTGPKGFWCKKSSKLGHTDIINLEKGMIFSMEKPKFIQMETLSA